MASQALELDRRRVAKREHRRFRVAVFPLEPRDRVEALVDGLEPPGRHDDAFPQRADRCQRVLDQGAGAVDRIGRGGERRIEPREISQQTRGAMEPAHRRAVVVVEQACGLGEPGRQPLGMLEPPALHPQLLFLPRPQPRGVELRDLEPQQILALDPIPLRRPRALELGSGGAVLREQVAHAVAQLVGIREPIQEVELPGRLEQALVLVLAVDLHQMVAEPLEQTHRHRRVVDEGAMPAGPRELPANHELPLVESEPSFVEHGLNRAAGPDFEQGLHGSGLRIGADDIGLGAGTADQEDRVEQHRLAGAGLAGEHVEPGSEGRRHGVDHGEVADSNLEEHLADARSARQPPQAVSERRRC